MCKNNLKIDLKLIAVIAVLGLTAYSFVLGASFKTLDDMGAIVVNENIKSFSNVGELFKSAYKTNKVMLGVSRKYIFFDYPFGRNIHS